MIKNFLIINCTGINDKIGLKIDKNFFIHDLNNKIKNNDQLTLTILNLVKKHKVNLDQSFSLLVNKGPGAFSTIRVSLAVAKGIKLSKNIKLYGFKNSDLGQLTLANIEYLIEKNLMQKNLIKPLYLS